MGDNDLARFQAHLSAALEKIDPGLDELIGTGTQTAPLLEVEAVQGYKLLRMDRNGWIKLNTDGENLKV